MGQKALAMGITDCAMSLPFILTKNAYQAGKPLNNKLTYGCMYLAINSFGYWSTSECTSTGQIAATSVAAVGEIISRPLLTRSVLNPTRGLGFLMIKEASFWGGVSLSNIQMRDGNMFMSFVSQLLMGGVIGNVGDTFFGRCIAKQWSFSQTMNWVASQQGRREFVYSYIKSCPPRVVSAVLIPYGVLYIFQCTHIKL